MNLKKLVYLLFTLFVVSTCLISCSTSPDQNALNRSTASEIKTPISLEQLLTISSSPQSVSSENYIKKIQSKFMMSQVRIQFIEDEKMPSDIAYKIRPIIENQKYVLKITHAKNAKIDLDASSELSSLLDVVLNKKFVSPFSIFELYYNAKENDFISLQALAKLRREAISGNNGISAFNSNVVDRLGDKKTYWDDINLVFDSEERVYNKKVKIQDEKRRAVMDALDKVSEDQQFRNLVAKNDRKGAAKLLREYLPWEQMPPFEKKFWENHLSIVADPLPYEDRVLIYRGINDDIIQVAQDAQKVLTKEDALREQSIFLMSTLMTKNQGSWNRRLRSLTSMYEKFMGTDLEGSNEYTKAARITNMFVKHSKAPNGSPFLSYSPNFNVASLFGSKRNTAYFIDPRMIYFNYASLFSTEIEFLLPIMSFPDDLAAVYDKEIHPEGTADVEKFLKEKAISKLEKEFGKAKGAEIFKRIELNSEKYFKPVLKANTSGAVSTNQSPAGKILSLFKSLLGVPTEEAADKITEKSDMPCLDLIQLFWK